MVLTCVEKFVAGRFNIILMLMRGCIRIARNVALYLPSNQIIEELLEIGAKIEQCVLVFLEEITVGLKKSTKV